MPESPNPPNGPATNATAATDPVPVPPPETRTPVQLNQQINLNQQIPPSAWDKFSPEDTLQAMKMILEQADRNDKRQFDFAMDQARRLESDDKRRMRIGSAVMIAAYLTSAGLALSGHGMVAGILAAAITGSLLTIFGSYLRR